jgi:hypothetical protein
VQEAAVLQGTQQSLTSIQTALQGLAPTTSNVLHTPLATVRLVSPQVQIFDCVASNVTSEVKTVLIELLVGTGTQVFDATTANISPGSTSAVGGSSELAPSVRCRFTVQNGTKQDIVDPTLRWFPASIDCECRRQRRRELLFHKHYRLPDQPAVGARGDRYGNGGRKRQLLRAALIG